MDKEEKIKILFEKHSNQVLEKRKKIHSTTEKYVGLNLVIVGWTASITKNLDLTNKLLILVILLIITGITMYIIFRDNRIYREHAKIVRKLSESLGAFEKGGVIKGVLLYPKSWQKFGKESLVHGILHHYIVIICIGFLTCIGLFYFN